MSFLGFKDLHIDSVDDFEAKTHYSNADVFASNASSSRAHDSVNMSK